MKLFALITAVTLAFLLSSARAQQGPDDQYIQIYAAIQNADTLSVSGQPRQALSEYTEAQNDLKKFSLVYPDWSPKLVSFRLSYLADKIAATAALLPADAGVTTPSGTTAAAVPPASKVVAGEDPQLADLRTQVQSLQADNATLTAKLKEALTAEPKGVDPSELAAAQDKIRSLMKENDLLQVSLAEQKKPADARSQKAESKALAQAQKSLADLKKERDDLKKERDDLQDKLKAEAKAHSGKESRAEVNAKVAQLTQQNETLRARLAVAEATPAPYSSDELALFTQTPPAPTTGAPEKKSTGEPAADPAALLAAAQTHFTAGEYDLALDLLSRAAALDPQNARIENLLGVTLAHKGLRSQAETALRKALLLDANYGEAHNNLAVIYADEQPPRAELARWHYLKALADGQPHNPGLEKILTDNGSPIPAQ
jgi:myosin heavy subunit